MDILRRLMSTFSSGASSSGAAPSPAIDQSIVEMIKAFEQEAARETLPYTQGDRHPTAQAILARPQAEWPEFVAAIAQRIKEIDAQLTTAQPRNGIWSRYWAHCCLLNRLLADPLPFTQEQLASVLEQCAWSVARFQGRVRLDLLIQQIKPLAVAASDHGPLSRALADFALALRSTGASGVRLSNTIERLLASKGTERPALVSSAWSDRVKSTAQNEGADKAIAHALTAAGKSKPSGAFLKAARAL
jgi:hypothetical protein